MPYWTLPTQKLRRRVVFNVCVCVCVCVYGYMHVCKCGVCFHFQRIFQGKRLNNCLDQSFIHQLMHN
jgi:hypothetical protein